MQRQGRLGLGSGEGVGEGEGEGEGEVCDSTCIIRP